MQGLCLGRSILVSCLKSKVLLGQRLAARPNSSFPALLGSPRALLTCEYKCSHMLKPFSNTRQLSERSIVMLVQAAAQHFQAPAFTPTWVCDVHYTAPQCLVTDSKFIMQYGQEKEKREICKICSACREEKACTKHVYVPERACTLSRQRKIVIWCHGPINWQLSLP